MSAFARSSRAALVVALLASLPHRSVAAQQRLPVDSLSVARRWSGWFLTGHADSLAVRATPEFLAEMGGVEGLRDAQGMVAQRAGLAMRVIEERFVWRNGRRQYWRTMEMTNFPEPFVMRFVMLEDGRLSGLGLGPLSAVPPAAAADR
jgi:hypothetical protein